MNIGELTTGYFSKCDIERELIISRILGECLIEIEVGGVTQKRLKEHIKMLQDKAVENEHYEVAEVFKIVVNKLETTKIGL
jgi:hypothetical protein